jgi:outer membrane lipoprotein-sorting protein
LGLSLLFASAAVAQAAEEKGLAIAIESDRRASGFGDSVVDLRMTLKNKHGQESGRVLRVQTLEGPSDGDKSLSLFDQPPDVKGTALLTFAHKTGPDDQWLYLPAVKRVKRIASADKSGSFMGSEFAYEDIASQEVEKYTYKYLRDETYEGQAVFVSERYPVDKNSGYTRQVVWMDQKEYRPLKIDYYDRKESLLKTLTFTGYQHHLGKHWRADEMRMVNHQTGKSTRLQWSGWKFGAGLKDADFTQEALKRAR